MNKAPESTLSRRSFMGAAAAVAGAAAVGGLAGCTTPAEKTETPSEGASDGMEMTGTGVEARFADCQTIYQCCTPECQHHLLKAYVRDGKVVFVEPAETCFGRPCARGMSRPDMCNSSKRLTKPLRATGPKGSGQFEEISWDEAIDLIEQKINEALADGGPGSLMGNSGTGNLGSLSLFMMSSFMTWLGGSTPAEGNMCCGGIDAGLAPVLGDRMQPIHRELGEADYIINWGNNPAIGLGGYMEKYFDVQSRGGKVVTIDPYQSESADKSDEWIRPWPGTDSALALAMLKVVIDEELYDKEYLLAHTTAACLMDKATAMPVYLDAADPTSMVVVNPADESQVNLMELDGSFEPLLTLEGTSLADAYMTMFEAVKMEADKWGKEAVEAETSVAYDDVARIARDYAKADRAIIVQNMGGYQRTENGGYATATQVYLALFCGHIGHVGDGLYDACGSMNIVPSGAPFEVNPEAQAFDGIPIPNFGEHVLADQPRKINFLWNGWINPVAQWPNTNSVKAAFEHIPFVVTNELSMTATALWSDLVLPATTIFEHEDITHGIRNPQISIGEAGATPPGEAKYDLEIFHMVAERFGFGDKFDVADMDTYRSRVLEGSGVTLDELKEKKGVSAYDLNPDFIAYKDGMFFTPTGRANFFVQDWVDQGFPGIACHQRPVEHPLNTDSELAQKYPLAAIQRKTRTELHTSFKWTDTMLNLDGHKPYIIMNPVDAQARGISEADDVVAYNDRGEHAGRAFVTNRCKQGTVMLENGWDDSTASSSSNVTSNAWPTLGTLHCCNSTLVEVKKGM